MFANAPPEGNKQVSLISTYSHVIHVTKRVARYKNLVYNTFLSSCSEDIIDNLHDFVIVLEDHFQESLVDIAALALVDVVESCCIRKVLQV